MFVGLNRKQMMTIVIVLVSIVVVFVLAYTVIPRALVLLTRAAPANRVSIENSYLLGDKILAKADGEEAVSVNVFLNDKSGKPIIGQTAEIEGSNNVTKKNELSDNNGKVGFEIRSDKAGQQKIQALYQGVPIGQELVVTFR